MKPVALTLAGIACATDAALSTMRVGPRKLARGDGFEFGRPVDFRDLDAA